jgi:S1-C subfamily serine protease
LGITTSFLTAEIADAIGLPAQPGLLIQNVEPGSAADQSGLRAGDREVAIGNYLVVIGGDYIVAIDGQAVSSRYTLTRALERKKAGDVVRLTIMRGRRRLEVNVTLGESPQRL